MSTYLPHTDRAKKNITMTFRLDENVITTLRAESERRHISLNTIVNQILQR
jgi:predicted HicB family RNase H-like nuclease